MCMFGCTKKGGKKQRWEEIELVLVNEGVLYEISNDSFREAVLERNAAFIRLFESCFFNVTCVLVRPTPMSDLKGQRTWSGLPFVFFCWSFFFSFGLILYELFYRKIFKENKIKKKKNRIKKNKENWKFSYFQLFVFKSWDVLGVKWF